MTEIRKLTNHPYAQAHVEIDDNGNIAFISYNTLVIFAEKVTDVVYTLTCSGTYSATTRKQIGWFLKEYFGDVSYYDMKAIAYTGEEVIAFRKHAKFW